MTDLNHVVLIGRLTQDIGSDERSFGYIGNGLARANVSIAVNRAKKNGDQWIDEVSYFNITIWGKTAENLKPYLTKGKQICVEGHLKQDRCEKDGQKQSRVTIVADSVQLLGNSGGNNSYGNGDNSQNYQAGGAPKFQAINNPPVQSQDYTSDPYGYSGNDFSEDIPF